jgi:hypothetical protein
MRIINSLIFQFRIGLISPELLLIVRKVVRSHKTYLDYPRLYNLVKQFQRLNNRSTSHLQVAEFGVGRGGSALILA